MRNAAKTVFVCAISLLLVLTQFPALNSSYTYAEQKTYGGTVTVAYFFPLDLNPVYGWSYSLYFMAYDTLAKPDKDWNRELFAATSIQKTDEKTWKVTLRQNITFHDGHPLTAHDFKFTIDTVKVAGGYMSRFVTGIESVEVIDDYTFLVKAPKPTLVDTWTEGVYILPKHYWEANNATGKNATQFVNNPMIGSGPFKSVDYRAGDYLVLAANENYWKGRPYIDKLVLKYYTNMDAAVAALKAGEVDMVNNVAITTLESLKNEANITVSAVLAPEERNIWFNLNPGTLKGVQSKGNPTLLDKRVRLAILTATNTSYINEFLFHGRFTAGTVMPVPVMFSKYYDKELEKSLPVFNLTKANKILDDAGYVKGTDGIRTGPNNTKLNLRLLISTIRPEEVQLGTILKGWYEQIGVNLIPEVVDSATASNLNTVSCDFDIALTAWGAWDCHSVLVPMTTDYCKISNPAWYSDAEYDALAVREISTTNQTEYTEVVKLMQKNLLDNAVGMCYANVAYTGAYRSDKIGGVVDNPGGILGKVCHRICGLDNSVYVKTAAVVTEQPFPIELIVGIVVAVVAIAVVATLLYKRRKK